MVIGAAEFNQQMDVQAVTRAPNAAGERTETWASLGTRWAKVVPGKARDAVAAGQPKAPFDIRVVLRAAADLPTPQPHTHRLVWRGGTYAITSSAPMLSKGGGPAYVELLATSQLKDQ